MKNVLIALLSVFFISSLGAQSAVNGFKLRKRERIPESFVLNLPEEESVKWKWAHQSAHPDNSFIVCEYIPSDQTITDWHEMISITYSSDTTQSVAKLLNTIKDQVFDAHRRSLVRWTLHKANEHEAIYEWSLPRGHYRIPIQSHLVRLVKNDEGIHTLVYSEKSPKIDDETRQDWIDYFSLGKVKK